MSNVPKVYLAGPAVFHPAAQAMYGFMKETCALKGLRGVSPLDGEGLWMDLPLDQQAAAIRAGNIQLIRECDGVIACIAPFRGPGADAGTAWEMGYAEALGKPVFTWTEDAGEYKSRVPLDVDPDGNAFCKQHGMLVEDFGLVDNLMMTAGPHPNCVGFEAAAAQAADLLLK